MQIAQITDPSEFKADMFPFLLASEAQNCFLLGLIDTLINRPEVYPKFHLWKVEDQGKVVGAAWLTGSPHPLGLTKMPAFAIGELVKQALKLPASLDGVVGPKAAVEEFTAQYIKESGCALKSMMDQGLYQAETAACPFPVAGEMRTVVESDYALLASWNLRYAIDCKLPSTQEEANAAARAAIDTGNRVLWIDQGKPVSMAAFNGKTPSGIRVSWVYTPPELRGKGYATGLTAKLTQKLLGEGHKFVFLYTDLANPTSNSIYQKIGYRPICESAYYTFDV